MLTHRTGLFKGKQVRKTSYNGEWWFVVEDVVDLFVASADIKQYIRRMRSRDLAISKGWVQFVLPLRIFTSGGYQKMNCANSAGIFFIIQSIPSPKAEPFRRWLAKVGYDLTLENNNKIPKQVKLRHHRSDLELIFSINATILE